MLQGAPYSYLLIAISCAGLTFNMGSLCIVARQKFRKLFHRLLVLLALYDSMVVVLCSMLWALPSIWPEYRTSVYPYWARYLYPAVQIALMSSVYCTIVLSWERYVRICLMSRLMNCSHYISDRAFLLYLGFIVVFPIIFYIPKFFELEAGLNNKTESMPISCQVYSNLKSYMPNVSLESLEDPDMDIATICNQTTPDNKNWTGTILIKIDQNMTEMVPVESDLRKNETYYNLYCIWTNNVFATFFPFITLMFFNISIAMELKSSKRKKSTVMLLLTRGKQVNNEENEESSPGGPTQNGSPDSGRRSRSSRQPKTARRLCIRFSKSADSPESSSYYQISQNGINETTHDNIETSSFGRSRNHRVSSSRGRSSQRSSPTLRRSNSPVCRRRENRLTRISLCIVWIFLFCHIWKLIPTFYEVFYGSEEFPQWLNYISNISHAFIVLNSSVNFLIYVVL